MLRSLIALLVFLSASTAAAQSWWYEPLYQPTASDVAKLPLSVTFDIVDASGLGWLAVSGNTWEPVWPRNANGAWYRLLTYTQPALRKTRLWPYPYSCTAANSQFRCYDQTRGIYRTVVCPAAAIGPLYKWRSVYNAVWREQGLFWPTQGPFGATTGRTIPLQSTEVTASGTTLHCKYGQITSAGAGLLTDVWVFRR